MLAGHSYAGGVISCVADRAPERLQRVVYVDAMVPPDGASLFDLGGPEFRAALEAAAGGGWRIPFQQLLALAGEPRAPRLYLRCTRSPGAVPDGWDHVELDAGHWPMFTAPEALSAALTR